MVYYIVTSQKATRKFTDEDEARKEARAWLRRKHPGLCIEIWVNNLNTGETLPF